MKKIFDILPPFILVLIIFLIGLPTLQLPWSLVDDGESLRVVKKIGETFPNISWLFSFEAERGRLRSAYWLFQFLEFKLFKLNVSYHHLFHVGLFGLAAVLLYFLIKKLTQSKAAGFFSSLLFIFFFPHFENLYRLGPVEGYLVVLLLIIFLILLKIYQTKKANFRQNTFFIFAASILFLIALLTKETAAVLIPFTLLLSGLSLFKRKKDNFKSLLLLSLIFSLTTASLRILAAVVGISGGYTTFYDFSAKQIYWAAKGFLRIIEDSFGLLFWTLIVSFVAEILIYWLVLKKIPKLLEQRILLLSWFLLFLAVQLPWIFVLGRYLTPALIGLSGFLGVQFVVLFSYFWQFWQKNIVKIWILPIFTIFIGLSIFLFFNSNIWQIAALYKRVISSEKQNSQVVEYLVKNTNSGKIIYFNVAETDEYFYEMPIHFRFFYDRNDLKTELLILEKPLNLNSGDKVATWTRTAKYNQEKLESFLSKKIKKDYQIGEWTIYKVI